MLYWISIIITLLIAVLIFRVIVRRDYLTRGSLSVISVTLEFVIFAMHANLPYLYLGVPWPGMPPLPDSNLLSILGLSIIGLGLLATLIIMAHLGYGTTLGQQPGEVRQTGPYRWTRNPQLLSYGVMLLGLGILYPSIQTAAWILLYAAIGHLMVLTEEEHLKNQFGDNYLEYFSQVPRYIFRFKSILPKKPKI